MSKRRRTDIYLSEEGIRWLQDMATRNGMTTKQHTGIPRGNISGFLEAVAAGRVVVTDVFRETTETTTQRPDS